MTTYIYKITNLKNQKSYIGKHTWKGEGVDNRYWGSGILIRRIIDKYGIENFSREVLEFVENPEDVFCKESEWIEKCNTLVPNGYNLTVKSLGGFYKIDQVTGELVFQGRSHWEELTDEEKALKLEKMHSLARTPEARKKISESNKRKYRNWSEEKWKSFKENCSKGWSKESREAMRLKVKGFRNGMYKKSYYERWIELYGKEKADKLMKEMRLKKSKKSKETSNNLEMRKKFSQTIKSKRKCPSYREWQHARAVCQGLKVRFKRGKISQDVFDAEFSIMKDKEKALSIKLKQELEIEKQN